MKIIEGGVTAAKGFEAASTAAKIKYQDRTDMAMIYSQVPCECAGTFTTNVVKAACVKWDQQVVKSGAKAQAVIVNSGIANACTGAEGFGYCKDTADAAAEALGINADGVLIGSTGVIGKQLPIDRIVAGVKALAEKKNDEIKEIEDEINKYQNQKKRLIKVYKDGILEMEDFAEDINVIDKKLAELKNMQIDSVDLIKETYKKEVIVPNNKFPRIKLADLYKELEERYNYKVAKEERNDLTTEAEKLAYKYAMEEYNSEFIFVTDYPKDKRAFYHLRENDIPQFGEVLK